MTRASIRLKPGALRKVRQSSEVTAELGRRARRIAAAANAASGLSGYIASTYQGRTRARGTVITSDLDSTVDNAQEQRLLKSLDAGRGD